MQREGAVQEIPVALVKLGDLLQVRPGEKLPLDGVVVEGSSWMEESMLTGEPTPVAEGPGDAVIAASLNRSGSGSFSFRVSYVGADTLLSQIVELVRQAQGSRTWVQRLADQVVGWFVPVVIACPWALGLATPTSFMVASGKGAENGLIFRSVEALKTAGGLRTIRDRQDRHPHPRPAGGDRFRAAQRQPAAGGRDLAVDGRIEACFGIADPPKPGAEAVVAAQLGIERVIAEVRPADKADVIRRLQEQGDCGQRHHPYLWQPGRGAGGDRAQPSHHDQHPPEPGLRLRLQRGGPAHCRRIAVSLHQIVAEPDDRRRGDGVQLRVGGEQCPAPAPLPAHLPSRGRQLMVSSLAAALSTGEPLWRTIEQPLGLKLAVWRLAKVRGVLEVV